MSGGVDFGVSSNNPPINDLLLFGIQLLFGIGVYLRITGSICSCVIRAISIAQAICVFILDVATLGSECIGRRLRNQACISARGSSQRSSPASCLRGRRGIIIGIQGKLRFPSSRPRRLNEAFVLNLPTEYINNLVSQ